MHNSIDVAVKNYLDLKSAIPNVKILIVTKGVSNDVIKDFILRTGHLEYAENYASELKKWSEIVSLFPNINITFIGSFQSGNIRNIVKYCSAIYSISSIKDLEKVKKEATKKGRLMRYYAQVNIGMEKRKNGFYENEIMPELKGLFDGVMCIPPAFKDPIPYFIKMKNIANFLGVTNISMGMSSDYQSAIKHGATEVRVGSLIFKKKS